jgi:hypothetical protein
VAGAITSLLSHRMIAAHYISVAKEFGAGAES